MSREAMQQALDALSDITYNEDDGKCNACGHEYGGFGEHHPGCKVDAACDALRAALARPQAEPVAWASMRQDGVTVYSCSPLKYDHFDTPLYATPQQAQPAPVPDWHDHSRGMFAARLEQMQKDGDTWLTITAVFALMADCDMLASREMIAAAPAAPAVQPLTPMDVFSDDNIMAANAQLGLHIDQIMLLIRAIEQAHGIAAPGSADHV